MIKSTLVSSEQNRWHSTDIFQIHFLEKKMESESDLNDLSSYGSDWQYASIGSGNGLLCKFTNKFYCEKNKTKQNRLHHNDVIKWKHFPRNWSFVRGIHRSPVNSPHKGQWHRAFMFSLICAWTDGWVNNRDASDLRRHRAQYDVTVMIFYSLGHFYAPFHFHSEAYFHLPVTAESLV